MGTYYVTKESQEIAGCRLIRYGNGQGGAPLAGAGLGGDPLQALLFGVVGLGDGGVELVGTRGVVPLKLVVNLGRGLELLLQAVGPDQGGGAVHLIEIPDLLGDGDVGCRWREILGLSHNRQAVEWLVERCNTLELDPIHLEDVVQDFLWEQGEPMRTIAG